MLKEMCGLIWKKLLFIYSFVYIFNGFMHPELVVVVIFIFLLLLLLIISS